MLAAAQRPWGLGHPSSRASGSWWDRGRSGRPSTCLSRRRTPSPNREQCFVFFKSAGRLKIRERQEGVRKELAGSSSCVPEGTLGRKHISFSTTPQLRQGSPGSQSWGARPPGSRVLQSGRDLGHLQGGQSWEDRTPERSRRNRSFGKKATGWAASLVRHQAGQDLQGLRNPVEGDVQEYPGPS